MIKKGDLYYPSDEFKEKAFLNKQSVYKEAEKDPIKYWEEVASNLFWFEKWKKGFSHNPPYFKWFEGGKINITSNIFEKNPAGFENIKDKVALIWEPEPTEEKATEFTYGQLFEEVNRVANALKKLGVKKGDRVGIYLPMIPEVVISLLACARIGAVHTVVFSAFSSTALQARLLDSEAEVLITSDGYYRGGKVINLKANADEGVKDTKVNKVVVVKRTGNEINIVSGRDFWWNDLIGKESIECDAEIMDAEDPLFILYTSGSTGKPKGCLHVCGGYAVQAYWTTKSIFDLRDDDIFWSTADIGWITGHTYSCYGPLLCGATFVIFEGLIIFPEQDRW
jgi:acetyl-CoA synthetase